MALALKSIKNTAFKLEEKVELTNRYFPGLLPQPILIESDINYPTIGYVIDTDTHLNNKALIVRVIDIKNPPSGMLNMPGKAKGSVFQYLSGQGIYTLDYDSIRRLLNGPKGTSIDVILKDEHTNKGAEDIYELTF